MTTPPNDKRANLPAETPSAPDTLPDTPIKLPKIDIPTPAEATSGDHSPDLHSPDLEESLAQDSTPSLDQSPTRESHANSATHVSSSAIVPFQPSANGKLQSRIHQGIKPRRFGLAQLAKGTFWAGVFGSTAIVTAGLGAIAVLAFPFPRQASGETAAPPLTELWRSGFRYQVSRPVTILLMGLDEARDVPGAQPGDLVGRTDTMLLARVDPEAQTLNVMSIPRDTRVEMPGYGIEKINQANFEGGAELAVETVTHNFDDVSIDRYVRVSTQAFKEIVDLVGGVEVMVPKPMKYEDKTQGLFIDLEPGLQNLNGDEAEQFARFRQDAYGDIGRVQRQQTLLKALRQRLTNPSVLPKLPQILRVLQRHIDTNLTLEEMLALAGFGLNRENIDLQMVMLPGRFSDPEEYTASYWIADQSASSDLMRTYFDTQPADLVASNSGANYYEAPSDRTIGRLRIAVQNATGDQYASSSVAAYLREQGFGNVYVMRDWSEVDRETAVIAQRGDLGSARSVRSALNVGQVVSDSTGDIDSDITIRVGEDWLMQVDPTWQRLPYDGPR
ncbi:MAG: LCP family protein [Phormidesmis sp.]